MPFECHSSQSGIHGYFRSLWGIENWRRFSSSMAEGTISPRMQNGKISEASKSPARKPTIVLSSSSGKVGSLTFEVAGKATDKGFGRIEIRRKRQPFSPPPRQALSELHGSSQIKANQGKSRRETGLDSGKIKATPLTPASGESSQIKVSKGKSTRPEPVEGASSSLDAKRDSVMATTADRAFSKIRSPAPHP